MIDVYYKQETQNFVRCSYKSIIIQQIGQKYKANVPKGIIFFINSFLPKTQVTSYHTNYISKGKKFLPDYLWTEKLNPKNEL